MRAAMPRLSAGRTRSPPPPIIYPGPPYNFAGAMGEAFGGGGG
jgi:hypothetical protein